MNADGTIAGAQGLNLTDGSGRMIPVNLSVSIPMSTFPQMNNGDTGVDAEQSVDSNIFTQADKMDGVIDMLPESSRQLTTGQSTSSRSLDIDLFYLFVCLFSYLNNLFLTIPENLVERNFRCDRNIT